MVDGFDFPLGVYPIDPIHPREGYTSAFEPADAEPGDDGPAGSDRDDEAGGDSPGQGRARRAPDDAEGDSPEFHGFDDPGHVFESEDHRGAAGTPRPSRGGDVPLDDRLPDAERDDDDLGGLGELDDRGGDRGGDGEPGDEASDEAGDGALGRSEGGADADGEFEPWPDRYVWDINIRHGRVEALIRALLAIMPGRVYPILDVLGNDAYREVDPYMAVELVGQERLAEGLRRFRSFLCEDGLVGFGAMSEEPFVYLFVDEHKIVTVRAEVAMKERVEAVLEAFDLPQTDQLVGVDSATHEHRSVLHAPPDQPELLTAEEILEELQDIWNLELNLDPHTNLDEQGNELGETGWRALVRLVGNAGTVRYVEAYLTADCYAAARDRAVEAAHELAQAEGDAELLGEHDPVDVAVLTCDRLLPEDLEKARSKAKKRATNRSISGSGGGKHRGDGSRESKGAGAAGGAPGDRASQRPEGGEAGEGGGGAGEAGGGRPAPPNTPAQPGEVPGVILARWLD